MRDPKIDPIDGDVLLLGAVERHVGYRTDAQHVRFRRSAGSMARWTLVKIDEWRAWAKKARVIRRGMG